MAKTPWMTSNQLVEAVQRKISIPLSQDTFSISSVLDFLNEEMFISQVPQILEFHSEYFVTYKTLALQTNVSRYPIPDRAIGMKLRDVFWMDQTGNFAEMTQVEEHDRAYYQVNIGTNQAIHKFFIEGNEVVLVPSVTVAPQGSLVFVFYLRPNQLVKDDRAAIIESFQQTVTLNNSLISPLDKFVIQFPSTFSSSAYEVPFTAVSSAGGSITAIAVEGVQTLVTSTNHQLTTGQTVVISGSDSNPSINGTYEVQVLDANTFRIPTQITTAGTTGSFTCKNQFLIAGTGTLTAANLSAAINNVNCIDTSTASSNVITLSFSNINTTFMSLNTTAFVVPSSTIGIEFNSVPTTYTDTETNTIEALFEPDTYIDLLQTKPGHKIYVYDVKIPTNGISGNVVTFPVTSLLVPTGTINASAQNGFPQGTGIQYMLAPLVPGDYMCLANEAIIPQIPPDLHNGLAERGSARILAASGDQQGLQTSMAKIQEIRSSEGNLMSNRSDGNPLKVVARKSLLHMGKLGYRRRF